MSKPTFKATLNHNLRETHTTNPKILLTEVQKDGKPFRSHCWISSKDFLHLRPKTNRYKVSIEFNAEEFTYQSSEGPKQGIRKPQNITKCKRYL